VWQTILVFHDASCADKETARKIKDMLVWYRYLTSCREMPLSIKSGELTNFNLIIIQRAHEEICRLSKPLVDINSYGSTLNSIMGFGDHYQYSYFSHDADIKCLNIPGGDKGIILHLHNGRKRAITGDAVTGLLQVVWTTMGRLFVDDTLRHLLVSPYVTNAAPYEEESSFPTADYALFHKEMIINELEAVREPTLPPSSNSAWSASPMGELLRLESVQETDHEKCVQQACCYTDDFLLWAFQELIPRH
jgi:hypothetical protein